MDNGMFSEKPQSKLRAGLSAGDVVAHVVKSGMSQAHLCAAEKVQTADTKERGDLQR